MTIKIGFQNGRLVPSKRVKNFINQNPPRLKREVVERTRISLNTGDVFFKPIKKPYLFCAGGMDLVTTAVEMRAVMDLVMDQHSFRADLDALLLKAFWADQSYFTTEEDVRCAWGSLPCEDKLDFVRDWLRSLDSSSEVAFLVREQFVK